MFVAIFLMFLSVVLSKHVVVSPSSTPDKELVPRILANAYGRYRPSKTLC
jgi:hypothetical protein